jgi:NAD(P)-dependent dehydrogenase (short-subunit alcohol dehydrogenase family)
MSATAPLAGQVALVTGASRGIGAATAVELTRRGAHVVITARSQGGLEETDDRIRAVGGTATLLPLDLQDTASLDSLGPSLFERFRRLDILVSNAGEVGTLTPVPDIQIADWDEAMAINVSATLRLIRTTARLLLAAPAGRAAFISSRIVVRAPAYFAMYGATKAAAHYLVQSWAEETRNTPLRVNLIDPGPVATRLRRQAFPGEDQTNVPRPEDVAGGIADVCGPSETRHGAFIRVSPIPLG